MGMVVKYADNILKNFANALSVIFTVIGAIPLFHQYPSGWFIVGVAAVMLSVFMYGKTTPQVKLHLFLVSLAEEMCRFCLHIAAHSAALCTSCSLGFPSRGTRFSAANLAVTQAFAVPHLEHLYDSAPLQTSTAHAVVVSLGLVWAQVPVIQSRICACSVSRVTWRASGRLCCFVSRGTRRLRRASRRWRGAICCPARWTTRQASCGGCRLCAAAPTAPLTRMAAAAAMRAALSRASSSSPLLSPFSSRSSPSPTTPAPR